MILALDTATVVGWCAGAPGGEPRYGARDFSGARSSGEVFGRFHAWLTALCREHRPSLVVFEAPYIPQGRRAGAPINTIVLRRLAGLTGQVEAVAWELQIPCREATPLEVARFFLGTQRLKRAEKKQRTIEMCERYGWAPACDNAADALALWAMAEAKLALGLGRQRGAGPLFIPPKKKTPASGAKPRRAVRSDELGDSSSWVTTPM